MELLKCNSDTFNEPKADLYSGFNHFSPSSRSQVIFSQVVIISPKEASTIVFPVSRDDTLNNKKKCFLFFIIERMSIVCSSFEISNVQLIFHNHIYQYSTRPVWKLFVKMFPVCMFFVTCL